MATNIFKDYYDFADAGREAQTFGGPFTRKGVTYNAKGLSDRGQKMALDMRDQLSFNPTITSAQRPRSFNRTLTGAAPNSRHIYGEALDIAWPSSSAQKQEMYEAIASTLAKYGGGFVKTYSGHIHVDVGANRSGLQLAKGMPASIASALNTAFKASVKDVQTSLNRMGANLEVDGVLGPATAAAMQKHNYIETALQSPAGTPASQIDTFAELNNTQTQFPQMVPPDVPRARPQDIMLANAPSIPQARPGIGTGTLTPEDLAIDMAGVPPVYAGDIAGDSARRELAGILQGNPDLAEALMAKGDIALAQAVPRARPDLPGDVVFAQAPTIEKKPITTTTFDQVPIDIGAAIMSAPTTEAAPADFDTLAGITNPGITNPAQGASMQAQPLIADDPGNYQIGPPSLGDIDRMATGLSIDLSQAPTINPQQGFQHTPDPYGIGGADEGFAPQITNAPTQTAQGTEYNNPFGMEFDPFSQPGAVSQFSAQTSTPKGDFGPDPYQGWIEQGVIDQSPFSQAPAAASSSYGIGDPSIVSAPQLSSQSLAASGPMGGPWASSPPPAPSLDVTTQVDTFGSFPPNVMDDMYLDMTAPAPAVSTAPVSPVSPVPSLGPPAAAPQLQPKAPPLYASIPKIDPIAAWNSIKAKVSQATNNAIGTIATNPDAYVSSAIQQAKNRPGATTGSVMGAARAARGLAQPRLYFGPQSGTSNAVQSFNEYNDLSAAGFDAAANKAAAGLY